MSTQAVEERRSVTFGVVFGILAIFTILEIAIGYIAGLPPAIKTSVLVFLAIVKVALVLLFFMHLKFDSRLFALPFALGIVLAIPISLIIGLTLQAPVSTEFKEAQAVNAATGQVIDVKEVSFRIHLSQDHANAGPITFHIVNGADDMLHEFIIIKTDEPPGELPTDMSGRVEEDAVTIIAAAEDIPPSNSRNLTVNLAAGQYVIVCNLPGHYLQGMRVEFTVTGTSNEPPSTPESIPATEEPTSMPEATATP
jgi:caa(3)-type oxidase subunit IV